MRSDILWPLIGGLATLLYLLYQIRSARQGKDTSMQSLSFTLARGVAARWLFLIVMPVLIVVIVLMGRFAPNALSAVPRWFIPAIIFGTPLAAIALTLRSLAQRRVR